MIEWVLLLLMASFVAAAPPTWALGLVVAADSLGILVAGFDVSSLLLLVLFLRFLRRAAPLLATHRLILAWMLLVAWAALSISWATSQPRALETVRAYARVGLGMAAALAVLRAHPNVRGLFWGCAAALAWIAVRATVLPAWDTATARLEAELSAEAGRVVIGDRTSYAALQAAWAGAFAAGLLPLLAPPRRWSTLLGEGVLLSAAAAVTLLLGSRAALACVLVSGFLLLLRWMPAAALGAVGLGLALLATFHVTTRSLDLPLTSEETDERVRFALEGQDDTDRLNIWRTGLAIAADHPVVGVGAGNAPVYYDRYFFKVWLDPMAHLGRTLHNSFLTMGVELGLVGLAIFAAFARIGWRAPPMTPAPACRLLGHISLALVALTGMMHSFEQSSGFMILIASAYAIRRFESSPAGAAPSLDVRPPASLVRTTATAGAS